MPFLLSQQLQLLRQLSSLAASSYVFSPMGGVPGAGMEVPGAFSQRFQQLLRGGCLWLFTCSCAKGTENYHVPFKTPHLGNAQNQGWAKLLPANSCMGVVGQKHSLEMISPFCLSQTVILSWFVFKEFWRYSKGLHFPEMSYPFPLVFLTWLQLNF